MQGLSFAIFIQVTSIMVTLTCRQPVSYLANEFELASELPNRTQNVILYCICRVAYSVAIGSTS